MFQLRDHVSPCRTSQKGTTHEQQQQFFRCYSRKSISSMYTNTVFINLTPNSPHSTTDLKQQQHVNGPSSDRLLPWAFRKMRVVVSPKNGYGFLGSNSVWHSLSFEINYWHYFITFHLNVPGVSICLHSFNHFILHETPHLQNHGRHTACECVSSLISLSY